MNLRGVEKSAVVTHGTPTITLCFRNHNGNGVSLNVFQLLSDLVLILLLVNFLF